MNTNSRESSENARRALRMKNFGFEASESMTSNLQEISKRKGKGGT
jgi:hypothetical protein